MHSEPKGRGRRAIGFVKNMTIASTTYCNSSRLVIIPMSTDDESINGSIVLPGTRQDSRAINRTMGPGPRPSPSPCAEGPNPGHTSTTAAAKPSSIYLSPANHRQSFSLFFCSALPGLPQHRPASPAAAAGGGRCPPAAQGGAGAGRWRPGTPAPAAPAPRPAAAGGGRPGAGLPARPTRTGTRARGEGGGALGGGRTCA